MGCRAATNRYGGPVAAGWVLGLGLGLLLAGPVLAQGQPQAWVDQVRGAGLAQRAGEAPRILGNGLPLQEGDVVTVAPGGAALVRLSDGSRMTVRPDTSFQIETYRFRDGAPDNSLVMRLLRGGLRVLTGRLTKDAPEAGRIHTTTATIGIRGTDFDARLCAADDCANEPRRAGREARPNGVRASARVASVRGELFAVAATGERRLLAQGAGVYPGDVVESGAQTQALLVFRDQSRTTLGGGTRLRVDDFVYDEANAGDGRFLVSLLRGSMRSLTGLIGGANPRNVKVQTTTATVGIRGTGFDLRCDGTCASEPEAPGTGLAVFTWQGTVEATRPGGAVQVIEAGRGLAFNAAGEQPLDASPAEGLERPDGATVPPKLFGTAPVDPSREGLYVFVRDGHVELITASQRLHLGRGEAGYADPGGETSRPDTVPPFIDNDPTPLPSRENFTLSILLNELGIETSNVCR